MAVEDLALLLKKQGSLALGTWVFAGDHWGGQNDFDSMTVLDAALEANVTHWDTARVYGKGHAERLIGNYLKQSSSEVFLASKGILGKNVDSFRHAFHNSLKCLLREYIDLYYIHWPKSAVEIAPYVEVLEKERSRGRLSYIGVSNFSVEQLKEAQKGGRIDAIQLCYSLLWRRHESDGLLDYCKEQGIAVICYSPLAQGILTGKFPREPIFKKDDVRKQTIYFREAVWAQIFPFVEELKSLLVPGQHLEQLALSWLLQKNTVDSVVVGARNVSQFNANQSALKAQFSQNQFKEAQEVSNQIYAILPEEENIFGYKP